MRPLARSALALLAASLPGQRYVVVDAVGPNDPYAAVVRALVEHHQATVLRLHSGDLAALTDPLRRLAPEFVAVVVRPEQLDLGFARRVLQLATRLDEDPFVDFSYGYVTGATAADTVAMLERGWRAEREMPPLSVGELAVTGRERSVRNTVSLPLRRTQIPRIAGNLGGGADNDHEHRDTAFLRDFLPQLEGRSAIVLSGHGQPPHVVCGPDFADFAHVDLYPAVVFNIACMTGVTQTYWERDWQHGVLRRASIPLEQSFALAVLRAGAIGYVAYVSNRPAGPELYTDVAALLADGASLGETRRRDYDKLVLGFLAYGETPLRLAPLVDGAPLARPTDPVRDLMLEGATGGVLFGDPATRPFAPRPGDAPVAVDVIDRGTTVQVRAHVAERHAFYHCSDQTARWSDGEMAMRVHHRLPLGDRFVRSIRVVRATAGSENLPTRLVWAFERDGGANFAQVKVLFPRGHRSNLTFELIVDTTRERALARAQFVQASEAAAAPRAAAAATREDRRNAQREQVRVQRSVSRAALDAARAATAALLARSPAAALRALRSFGSEGFRAVCVCIETGEHNAFSWRLLEATWHPGDEEHLLELARRPPLPEYGTWSVLHGLGVADTPRVRDYLLERLATERDPGLFMSAAAGLAHLREKRASERIAAQLMTFADGWSGVAPHLLRALVDIDGDAAAPFLAEYLDDPRANLEYGLRLLLRVDRAAARAAARRLLDAGGLSDTERATVDEVLR